MILVRAPFRVSFAGGGSDLPAFYRRGGGAVVSATIDKYMYIALHPYFQDKIRIKYSRTEDVDRVEEIQHPLVRESLCLLGFEPGMEIASFADVPAGSGLGSSSAFTVCLLQALYAWRGEAADPGQLAAQACCVEIERAGEPIGKQDQYAASYGGLNFISFQADESVRVEPVGDSTTLGEALEERLLLFYIGRERAARDILAEQSQRMSEADKYARVRELVALAEELRQALAGGRLRILGEVLHRGWELKRGLARGITNEWVEECYGAAREAGAVGGKLLGAGGGGFLLLYCEPGQRARLRRALAGLRELPFRLSGRGSEILYRDNCVPVAAAGVRA